ncbi:MAG TPA: hypothetical protein VIL79_06065 [Thermoleophilia bacterium]
MILTDEDKVQAKELGLTQEEVRIAKATRIPLERYAFHKRELQAGRAADDAMMQRFSDAAGEGLETAYRGGRGVVLPPLDEESG